MNPEIYRNFLAWLCETFQTTEADFRRELVKPLRLTNGQRVLITGCGLGDDIPLMRETADVVIEAQDLAGDMLAVARERFPTVKFFKGDACALPYGDGELDAAFHFGGLNEFPDRKRGIHEMARVVKDGGRVAFSDEGVAPWLRDTDYGKMAITNNPLWQSTAPIDLLPFSATDVSLTWILGNCFYLISFTVQRSGPTINPDVKHAGRRGGSMRTRYYGQLEGVSDETKSQAIRAALAEGISVHDWLDRAIRRAL